MSVAHGAKMIANSMTTLIMIIVIIVIALGDREYGIKNRVGRIACTPS